MAILAIINDESRSDIQSLSERMSMMSNTDVTNILDKVLEHVKDSSILTAADPLLTVIMRECTAGNRLPKYVKSIYEYERRGIRALSFWDEEYPRNLRFITRPPLLLYVRGAVFPGSSPVAIVGTRHASSRGLELAFKYAEEMSESGRTVVSGLALGVDTEAHEGALAGSGDTIAVLPGHLDHITPMQNIGLAEEISKRGALVSEVTMNSYLHRGRFVERNRITSGISDAVLIVESVRRGGTLHQAKFSLGQGKPTFVIDHGVFQNPEAGEGFKHLVRIGAIPVSSPEEISSVMQNR